MRSTAVFIGVVTLILGVVGLIAPVSVSPEIRTVGCGSAVSPDLSEARANDDGVPTDIAMQDEVITGINYIELCRMDLKDRRILSITVTAAGVLILLVTAGVIARSRSRHSASAG